MIRGTYIAPSLRHWQVVSFAGRSYSRHDTYNLRLGLMKLLTIPERGALIRKSEMLGFLWELEIGWRSCAAVALTISTRRRVWFIPIVPSVRFHH